MLCIDKQSAYSTVHGKTFKLVKAASSSEKEEVVVVEVLREYMHDNANATLCYFDGWG